MNSGFGDKTLEESPKGAKEGRIIGDTLSTRSGWSSKKQLGLMHQSAQFESISGYAKKNEAESQQQFQAASKAFQERLNKSGIFFRNGSMVNLTELEIAGNQNGEKEERIRELEGRESQLKKQLREVQAKLEKDLAILNQKLEFSDLELKEYKQKLKDNDEFFSLFEINDLRYQQHPMFKQRFQQLNEIHTQQLLQKQREVDALSTQLRDALQHRSTNMSTDSQMDDFSFNNRGLSNPKNEDQITIENSYEPNEVQGFSKQTTRQDRELRSNIDSYNKSGQRSQQHPQMNEESINQNILGQSDLKNREYRINWNHSPIEESKSNNKSDIVEYQDLENKITQLEVEVNNYKQTEERSRLLEEECLQLREEVSQLKDRQSEQDNIYQLQVSELKESLQQEKDQSCQQMEQFKTQIQSQMKEEQREMMQESLNTIVMEREGAIQEYFEQEYLNKLEFYEKKHQEILEENQKNFDEQMIANEKAVAQQMKKREEVYLGKMTMKQQEFEQKVRQQELQIQTCKLELEGREHALQAMAKKNQEQSLSIQDVQSRLEESCLENDNLKNFLDKAQTSSKEKELERELTRYKELVPKLEQQIKKTADTTHHFYAQQMKDLETACQTQQIQIKELELKASRSQHTSQNNGISGNVSTQNIFLSNPPPGFEEVMLVLGKTDQEPHQVIQLLKNTLLQQDELLSAEKGKSRSEVATQQAHIKSLETLLLENRDAYYKERTLLEASIRQLENTLATFKNQFAQESSQAKKIAAQELSSALQSVNLEVASIKQQADMEISKIQRQADEKQVQGRRQADELINYERSQAQQEISLLKQQANEENQKIWRLADEKCSQIKQQAEQEIQKVNQQAEEVLANSTLVKDQKERLQARLDKENQNEIEVANHQVLLQVKNNEINEYKIRTEVLQNQLKEQDHLFKKNQSTSGQLQIENYKLLEQVSTLQNQQRQNTNHYERELQQLSQRFHDQINEFAQERQRFLETIDQLQQSVTYQNIKNQELITQCNEIELEEGGYEQQQEIIQNCEDKLRQKDNQMAEREKQFNFEIKKKEKTIGDLLQQIHILEFNRKELMDEVEEEQERFLQQIKSSRESEVMNTKGEQVNSKQIITALKEERDYLQKEMDILEQQRESLQRGLEEATQKYQVLELEKYSNQNQKNSPSKQSQQYQASKLGEMANSPSNLGYFSHKQSKSSIMGSTNITPGGGQGTTQGSAQFIPSTQMLENQSHYQGQESLQIGQYLSTSQFGGAYSSGQISQQQGQRNQQGYLNQQSSQAQQQSHSSQQQNYLSQSNFLQQGNSMSQSNVFNNNNNNNSNNNVGNSFLTNSSGNQIIFGSLNHSSLCGVSQAQMLEIIERAYMERLQQQQLFFKQKMSREREEIQKSLREPSIAADRKRLQQENENLHRDLSSLRSQRQIEEQHSSIQGREQRLLQDTAKLCQEKQLKKKSQGFSDQEPKEKDCKEKQEAKVIEFNLGKSKQPVQEFDVKPSFLWNQSQQQDKTTSIQQEDDIRKRRQPTNVQPGSIIMRHKNKNSLTEPTSLLVPGQLGQKSLWTQDFQAPSNSSQNNRSGNVLNRISQVNNPSSNPPTNSYLKNNGLTENFLKLPTTTSSQTPNPLNKIQSPSTLLSAFPHRESTPTILMKKSYITHDEQPSFQSISTSFAQQPRRIERSITETRIFNPSKLNLINK